MYTYPTTNGVPHFVPDSSNGDGCPTLQATLSTNTNADCDLECGPGFIGSPSTLVCAYDANDGDATIGAPTCTGNTQINVFMP